MGKLAKDIDGLFTEKQGAKNPAKILILTYN